MPRSSMKAQKGSKSSKKNLPEFYQGSGGFRMSNGDEYQGEYWAHRKGLIWREGKGVYRSKDNQVYNGVWKDDRIKDNTEVNIKYGDATEFKGRLVRNKYSGPGTYILKNGMEIHGSFANNKLVDELVLVDADGRMWHGNAKGDKAYLNPENIFYSNLTRWRGKSKKLLKGMEPEWKESALENASSIVSLPVKDLKEIVFAKSLKTKDDVDFEDSDWYRNFLDYKRKRNQILTKLREHQKLSVEEMRWYREYAKYKVISKSKKLTKVEEKVDTTLLDIVYGDEYKLSSKAYKVFHPSSKIMVFEDKVVSKNAIISEEEEVDSFEQDFESSANSIEEVDESCENIIQEVVFPECEEEAVEEVSSYSLFDIDHIALDTISMKDFVESIKVSSVKAGKPCPRRVKFCQNR